MLLPLRALRETHRLTRARFECIEGPDRRWGFFDRSRSLCSHSIRVPRCACSQSEKCAVLDVRPGSE